MLELLLTIGLNTPCIEDWAKEYVRLKEMAPMLAKGVWKAHMKDSKLRAFYYDQHLNIAVKSELCVGGESSLDMVRGRFYNQKQ